MATQISEKKSPTELVITWEALPDDFQLEDEPVENTGQPILAGALRESLEIAGFIQPQMLIASKFGLCATLDGQFIAKAPDWLFVPSVKDILPERKSYTPNLEGDVPAIVIEFLSDTEGGEYSVKRTYPPGKWFFYEQILQVPIYVIFDPDGGLLEFYQLENGHYSLKQPDENGLHWIDAMGLFLGTWRGEKETRSGYWLRWWDEAGNLLPWSVELISQERQRAEQERQEKERLIAYLKSQGIDPDNLPTAKP
ncbi:Uma2 family endonuclease [Sphaerospermopsis aphanizomenoides BCCUSP55]|uniref:Uma2 family endonuclease n=1 Tax=Sphaerospermopsis aphanizomenoides TaxID=459663 RepID=UPI000B01FADB|nr:Uma2 family endonuclease [Sphaerospermopsis aphanizomenoides]MBK1989302.1 Uma2 family endonuclease [Sphaerospermopsis aphanizomenoides BCCUSP55]